MIKGKDTFEEVQACIEAVGGECASGWSQNALTVALLTVMTNWMAVRCLNGSTVEAETTRLTEYLTKSVSTKVAEVRDAKRGAH